MQPGENFSAKAWFTARTGILFALGVVLLLSSPVFAETTAPANPPGDAGPLLQVNAEPVVISPAVNNTSIHAGSVFQVRIEADDIQNLGGMEAALSYDPDLLELLDVELDPEFSSTPNACFNEVNDTVPGILRLIVACTTSHPMNPPVSPMTIWTLTMEAASDLDEPTDTELVTFDTRLGSSDIPPRIIPSVGDTLVLTLFPGVCGDQNNDGSVDILDALIDLAIILELIEPTPLQLILSDVVIDGEINVGDVILILQHIVGLFEITECGSAVEIDHLERTTALVGIEMPDGTLINRVLRGPAEVHVFFEGSQEGDAFDDDGDGLDEVMTELVSMNLSGGGFTLNVRDSDDDPFMKSTGEIEEKVNNNPGELDLNPFHNGDANSFFDVYFEITAPDGTVLHNQDALRLEAMISEKPPKTQYSHVITEPIVLYDEEGNDTGFKLVTADHNTTPHFVEHDRFEDTEAQINLLGPDLNETIDLSGPAQVDVWFENGEGDAQDDDGNGLDEVMTKFVLLDLEGESSVGPVRVRLNPNVDSTGVIEEKENNTPGTLDLPPFAPGAANSWFDLNLMIIVNDQRLFTERPKRMSGMISHKPPNIGEMYENPDTIQLVDADGNPTEFSIGPGRHIPRPHFVEHDVFEETTAAITIIDENGETEIVDLSGPTLIDVWFERREGEARDDDSNGLDEVMTKVVDMRLVGESSRGRVVVVPNPNIMSTGVIEEKENNIPGVLEVPPFAPGAANSWFDMYFQVIMPEQNVALHTIDPKTMRGMIFHKPPDERTTYENPERIPLYFRNGEPSGMFIGPARHVPRPHFVEHDRFEETAATINLIGPDDFSETVELHGPTAVDVWFEQREGEARDDDSNGLDEVMTKMVGMDLRGESSLGPVRVTLNPSIMSTGMIEEKANNIPGILDIPPFARGAANSWFDIFFQVEVGDRVFRTDEPKVMRSMITHKPPIDSGTVYESPTTIPLLIDGQETGFFIGPATHRPRPHFVEHDVFEETEAKINILGPDGFNETIAVSGPTAIDVWFEDREGEARDDDDNGLDDVMTKVRHLRLVGKSETLGAVVVSLNPNVMSTGMIEENENNNPGILDVPPFTNAGSASSWFDMNLQIELPDRELLLLATKPKTMRGTIFHKPPDELTTYQNPEIIPLVTPLGVETGFSIGPATHVPRPHFVEHDVFEDTFASITLVNDETQESETVELTGPTSVDVWFERREGEARDDDDNGLDEVMTKVVGMRLTGESSLGPVLVGLNPMIMSTGAIEEKGNDIPGILEVPPFAPGSANSWFDIYLMVVVDGRVLLAREPKRMSGMIFHKPPDELTTYENPDTIPLFFQNGERSGFSIGPAKHVPRPHFVEHDRFEETEASINLIGPNGLNETVEVRGPTAVDVWFERREGEARDDDANGLDEVMTKMVGMDLRGESSLGPVRVGLNPLVESTGWIEENANNTPGVLDLPPFADGGTATSQFDVWFQIQVGDRILVAASPKIMRSVITHKPPRDPNTAYEGPGEIILLDLNGNETGFSIGPATHRPRPHFVEHDRFEETEAEITLVNDETQETETVKLRGGTLVDVWFERGEGEAQDDDGNGLDEVMTRMTAMRLIGESSMGLVVVSLHPSLPTVGMIEENVNNTPGVLDLPPFTDEGTADSWFDVNMAITMVDKGITLYTARPKHMSGVISHKPPIDPGTVYENPETIPLLTSNGERSGFSLGPAKHTPVPHFVEHDFFKETVANIQLIKPDQSSESIRLVGPTLIDVWFERGEGDAQDDDDDGLDEVMTKVRQLDLRGTSSMGAVVATLNPGIMSVGEIEENENNTPGTLDLPPFTEGGSATSWFDIYLMLVVETPEGRVRLFANDAKRMTSTITHKPPAPGEGYESPTTIPLFFANGEPSGFAIGPGNHTPNPHFVEHDVFEETEAGITIIDGDGNAETVQLKGPTVIDVWFEGREGEAQDDDGDQLDEVMTKVVELKLTGDSSMGEILVTLNPDMPSTGMIMENQNLKPGTLEVPPFGEGTATSWFDIFFQIEMEDGTVFHTKEPKSMHGVITHKPPDIGDFYMNPDRIELYDANDEPTGMWIGPTNHVPRPGHFVEVDTFEETQAKLLLITPNSEESIDLKGPAIVHVWFEGEKEGDAHDHDGNGLDEVMAKFVELKLTGESDSLGTVEVGLNPAMMSTGIIEERENNIPGVLEIKPFAEGSATSSFDMFVEIRAAGELLHNEEPKVMTTVITEKPPGKGETYQSPNVIPLFFKDGSESDFKLGASSHTPRPDDQEPPVVEIDSFPNSEAVIAIGFQDVVESVNLTGPTEVHVFFEGLKEGDAQDDDNDGLDEVPTEMVSMELRGNSELLGPIILRAGSGMGMRESPGEIEESFNEITGNLDVAPFLNGGTADSFFDIWFEIEVERQGEVFHNEDAARMEGLITHKPPAPGDQYSKPENVVVELYNDSGEPTGITIVRAIHTPNPRQDLPDLTVSLINPPTIVSCAAGQGSCLHTFEFEVFNNSNVDIPDDIEVLASTSELTVAGSIVTIAGGLGAGASSIQSVTLGPGNNCYNPNCTVIAQVDPSNLILESNEANNSDSRTDVG